MTIYSLTCERCKKTNCNKFYNCIHCNAIQCKECLDDTNPKRLTCRLLKDNNYGVEKTIYCVNHCTKTKNFCADCGRNFNFLKPCRKCRIFFCTDCRSRNNSSIKQFYVEGEDFYNRNLLTLSNYYCSTTCFELDHIYHNDDNKTVCKNCGEIYINSFNESECQRCLCRLRVDIDVDYNLKRIKLQNEVNKVLQEKKIDLPTLKKKVQEHMELEVIKNSFMETNHLTFDDWMTDLDEGSNKCFLMYDDCIIKILNTLGANIPESHLFYA